jgi:hypothetical protein
MSLGNKKLLVYDPVFLRRGEILYRRLKGFTQVDFNHYGNYAGFCKRRGHLVFEIQAGEMPKLVPYSEFAIGYEVFYEIVPDLDSAEAIRRMDTQLREGGRYNFLIKNCEHLSRYVAVGKAESPLIQSVATVFALSVALVFLSKN